MTESDEREAAERELVLARLKIKSSEKVVINTNLGQYKDEGNYKNAIYIGFSFFGDV